jgi:putative transcriptional regulator
MYNNQSISATFNRRSIIAADKLKLYNRLQVLRAERGLSRQELADAVGVNYQTIGYLERGDYNPSLELAFKLSEYFGLPIEVMFSTRPLKPLSEVLAETSKQKAGAP